MKKIREFLKYEVDWLMVTPIIFITVILLALVIGILLGCRVESTGKGVPLPLLIYLLK